MSKVPRKPLRVGPLSFWLIAEFRFVEALFA